MPDAVKDVYDADGYAEYLEIVAEERRLSHAEKTARLAVDVVLLISPLFALVDSLLGQNAYLAYALTSVLVSLVYAPADFAAAWWYEMRVEGKHGLSRLTTKEFALDYLRNNGVRFVLLLLVGLIVVFVCEHAYGWTNGFSLGLLGSLAVCAVIVGAFVALAYAAVAAKYHLDRKRLSFTDLPEGPLRDDIERMLSGCRKRVHAISVYDESSRSNSKNALISQFPWRRELAIADNFINENDHRELLAVVAHEIGHLRHRKDAVDVLSYASLAALFLAVLALLNDPSPFLFLDAQVRECFGLSAPSYYLDIVLVSALLWPVVVVVNAWTNYCERRKEYEADRYAARQGYGRELAALLKRIDRDELLNVNPHPFVAAVKRNHPSTARRVEAIKKEIDLMERGA